MAEYAQWPRLDGFGGGEAPLMARLLHSNYELLASPRKVPLHKHCSWQADFILEGRALVFDMSGRKLALAQGEIVFIPPESAHGFIYRRKGVRWLTFWFALEGASLQEGPLLLKPDSLSKALLEALKETQTGGRLRAAANPCAEHTLAALLALALPQRDEGMEIPDNIAGQTMKWILRSGGRRLSVKEMAQSLSCSQSHLSHSFKRQWGVSLKTFIDTERARTLERLLPISEMKPSRLAAELGFRDVCELSRFCKRRLGAAPRNLRSSE